LPLVLDDLFFALFLVLSGFSLFVIVFHLLSIDLLVVLNWVQLVGQVFNLFFRLFKGHLSVRVSPLVEVKLLLVRAGVRSLVHVVVVLVGLLN